MIPFLGNVQNAHSVQVTLHVFGCLGFDLMRCPFEVGYVGISEEGVKCLFCMVDASKKGKTEESSGAQQRTTITKNESLEKQIINENIIRDNET